MKKLLPFIVLALLLTGCSTIPGPVDERYLTEKTDEDAKLLQQIESQIIAKNREKQRSENNLKVNSPDIKTTEERLKLLKQENRLLRDQLALYTRGKDARNMEITETRLAENEKTLQKKETLLNYQRSWVKFHEADAELKNAELAVLVARRNLEQSRIAEEYRDRNEPVEEREKGFFSSLFRKNDDDRYGYKKYRTHLDRMKKNRERSEKKFRDASAEYQAAEKTLNRRAEEVKDNE